MGERIIDILENIRVLELADETGSFCGKLLADLGADVTKVDPRNIDMHLNTVPGRETHSSEALSSCSYRYSNACKEIRSLDLHTGEGKQKFNRMILQSDCLIETVSQNVLESLNLTKKEVRYRYPKLIHLSITPFGRSGPKKQYRSSATVASAAGGQMFFCRNSEGQPLALYGLQPYYTASLCGAVAILLALRKRRITGKGYTIDISIQEAVASTLDNAPVAYISESRKSGVRKKSSSLPEFRFFPCKDGYIQISLIHSWETLAEIIFSETGAAYLRGASREDPLFCEEDIEHFIDIVEGWTLRHSKSELFELGQAMALPWAPVFEPREVLQSPQLNSRRFFIKSTMIPGDPECVFTGTPYRFAFSPTSAGEPNLSPEHMHAEKSTHSKRKAVKPRSVSFKNLLENIRVLDLTRMLSGPYCSRTLADFGAEVLKIQTLKTSHGAERNDTPYFSLWNRNKRSLCLDLGKTEARELFLDLVAQSEIVIENYSPRVMANWDLGYDRLKQANPDLIMLSLSAMGQTGPWKNYVGYGPTFHALSGLISASSPDPGGYPIHIGHAYGDSVAGLYGVLSILSALERKDSTGEGCHIDLSCYETLSTFLGPAFMRSDAAINSKSAIYPIEEYEQNIPDRAYPCTGDDRWCAITIQNDMQWQKLCSILGDPQLQSERFSTRAGRKENQEDLNTRISSWTRIRAAESVQATLQKAGIPAHMVQNVEDLAMDPQMSARRFFLTLKHPVLGNVRTDRSAVWPWNCRFGNREPSPVLGEANYDVFVRRLGISETKFNDYVRRGIIS